MELERIDWILIAVYFSITLLIGFWVARRASRSADEFFLSGRSMPWWLLGFSMVATTFSTDTPNLVTDIVRQRGVSGNWVWWAFLLTGMLTVFVYAKLWRRTGVMTDIEFYEKRYSGRSAAFLRGFRALYLGVFFNVMIMATVTLAAMKIAGVLLGVGKYTTVLFADTLTVAYSATAGLWGVVVTDLFQFAGKRLSAPGQRDLRHGKYCRVCYRCSRELQVYYCEKARREIAVRLQTGQIICLPGRDGGSVGCWCRRSIVGGRRNVAGIISGRRSGIARHLRYILRCRRCLRRGLIRLG